MKLIFYHQQMITDAFVRQVLTGRLQNNDGYTINRFIDSILRGEDVLDGKLAAIKAPTLIIWGRQDMLTPMGIGEALKQDITGSSLSVLDQCGHVPQLECAAPFNRALLDFLAGGS